MFLFISCLQLNADKSPFQRTYAAQVCYVPSPFRALTYFEFEKNFKCILYS